MITKNNRRVKVPMIMQLEAVECGAASLAMILAYYKKYVPLEKVRSDCGVSRDGVSAKHIVMAAQNYGLNVDAYRYETEDIIKSGKFPCIIHWNFNHFVVLKGFDKDCAYVNDPARGAVKVPMDEFDRAFTGICLIMKPTERFVADGKKASIAEFAKKRIKGSGIAAVFVFVTALIYSVFAAIYPAFSRVFADRILTGENLQWFKGFIALLTLIIALRIITAAVKAVFLLKIEGKFAAVANSEFVWHILRLPMTFFSQRYAGDILERQQSNEEVAKTLIETLVPLILDICVLVFYFIAMLRYSVILTAVGVAAIAVNVAAAKIISEKRKGITQVKLRDEGALYRSTISAISMADSIKAAGSENGVFERWAGYRTNVNNADVELSKTDGIAGNLPEFISECANAAVVILGIYMIMSGSFTIGMLLAFEGFLETFFEPSQTVIESGQTILEMSAGMARIEDVMNYRTETNNSIPAEEYDKLSGELVLENVTFGYSKFAAPVVKNISLTIKSGQSVAFVGKSGCGKSTIAKLISGLYKPNEGQILFDGKPIDEINRDVFKSSLAVVDQDIILFEDTIANNIKMWDNSIEDFEVILAARDAQIHENIMKRDGGYECMLTDGGKNFSGGERQRIEIARVLAQDPTIMIMDEATSALDAKTEYNVVRSVRDRGITCIAVAHRLSTIRDCDMIYVLDKGEIVEYGTHDELYALGGLYKELVSNE